MEKKCREYRRGKKMKKKKLKGNGRGREKKNVKRNKRK